MIGGRRDRDVRARSSFDDRKNLCQRKTIKDNEELKFNSQFNSMRHTFNKRTLCARACVCIYYYELQLVKASYSCTLETQLKAQKSEMKEDSM